MSPPAAGNTSSFYGTTTTHTTNINNNPHNLHNTISKSSETQPLLYPSTTMSTDNTTPALTKPFPPAPRWRRYLSSDVDRTHADLILIICYLITGLLDASSISIWGSFVSMQTGNTVYTGLGLAAPHESTRWIKSGTSLLAFCLGSFLFSRFHRFFGSPKARWVLCVSFLVQFALCVAAAAVVTVAGQPKDSNAIEWHVLLPIALLAFQSCGQAVMSRALKYNALTSVVLTSIYCDLFSDQELFKLHNVERNQRVGAPVFLFLGALFGGFFAHTDFGVAGALWMAAGLKLVVVVLWLVWPAEKKKPVVQHPNGLVRG
ncbi:hypothetical protein QBC32DRAFT_332910 [Pseudoneurospora amorphoporcata]|uniref:DUF1275 domain protein n=1 Tax=Pseudoneurospora amorphoporcata TaxID=241081 RepID=A0AAN6P0Y7_9PEZI|nr:hypothetical protein QBC32DRAFT_332910 [Pseudoneurospora amorphoporcata]